MTYPEPPNKSIFNDVMLKVYKAIEKKHRPFAVVVGDQPVYELPADIKNNYAENVKDIFTSLHTQCSMIHTIYKRFKGSGFADVLVTAGAIAEGSVDQALRGKHDRRALQCLMILYEALMYLLLKQQHRALDNGASTREQFNVLRDPITNSQ